MNNKQAHLKKMITLTLLTYVVITWLGVALRDATFGGLDLDRIRASLLDCSAVDTITHPKWLIYSGLFSLLKQKLRLSRKQVTTVSRAAEAAFAQLLYPDIRNFV